MSISGYSEKDTLWIMNQELLQAAVEIGDVLAQSAIWHDQRCNWVGRDLPNRRGGSAPASLSALGPDLYSGSAGVAIFMADLFSASGEEQFLKTAVGAIRRSSLQSAKDGAGGRYLSIFGGGLGVAYASLRVAETVGDESIGVPLSSVLKDVRDSLEEKHLLDLMGGTAGSIGTLLYIADRVKSDEPLSLAIRCGDELCDEATWAGSACSWGAEKASGAEFEGVPLGGLSHGSAGIAIALFRLYSRTGEVRYLETARAALMHDEQLYDSAQGNWVDARFPFRTVGGNRKIGAYVTAWCHGAGGIALAYLRAASSDPDHNLCVKHQEWADTALCKVAQEVTTYVAQERYDTALCHGILGLSDTLMISDRIANTSHHMELARQVSIEVTEKYRDDFHWPCGFDVAVHPSYMLGISGIGHHLLRMAGHNATSMLDVW